MPDDDVYIPLHVGREGKQDLGYIGDNTGENISSKNANYCELTGLYWAWKNLDCEYIGLCHYRRYFATSGCLQSWIREEKQRILSRQDYEYYLSRYDILLPSVNNMKVTLGQNYAQAHFYKDLLEVRNVICDKYPDYVLAFDEVINSKRGYFANMFVMKKVLFNDYSKWLFSILFEIEDKIDISNYDAYQARIFGFLSERLFSVWLYKNNYSKVEVPMVNLESKVKIKRRITRKIMKFIGI